MLVRPLPTPATVLVFGADDRVHALAELHDRIRTYASHREHGTRSRKRVEAALRAGRVGVVFCGGHDGERRRRSRCAWSLAHRD